MNGVYLTTNRKTKNCIVLLWFVLILLAAARLPAQYSPEEVKGEFVERFTRFIEWPSFSLGPDTTKPFVIAIVGSCSFENHLIDAFQGRKIKGHPPLVRILPSGSPVPDCHLLFIAKSETDRLQGILDSIGEKPVLTIADSENFAERGVHINLYIEKKLVRFEINLSAVQYAGLHISSKMLKHAKIIY